jgi:hypothetical protein
MTSIYICNTLDNLLYSLKNNNYSSKDTNDFHSTKYILKRDITSDLKNYSLRCWLSSSSYDYYMESNDNNYSIFSLDLIINDDNIKIEHLYINNDYYDREYNSNIKNLSNNEVLMLKKVIFDYIEDLAISKNKNKLIIDIHNNMKRFDNELKEEGFITTYNRCVDNPFWFEAVKYIK